MSSAISRVAERDVALGVIELAVRRAAQIVGGAVLMEQPGDLVRMAGEVGRELRGDDAVDRLAVALGQIDHPPRGGVREELVLRIPLERQSTRARRGSRARRSSSTSSRDVQLGAAVHERHLRFADHDRIDMRPVTSRSGS